MKKSIKQIEKTLWLIMLMIFSATGYIMAQDASANKTTTTSTTTSFEIQPWMWIVGGAVFVIILVALLRGGRKDSVTISRTTTTERSDV